LNSSLILLPDFITDNIFFVPFGQDNPTKKQNSLVARMDLIKSAAEKALHRQQLQPVIIEYSGL
jgi:dipicolinate synthase subunit B